MFEKIIFRKISFYLLGHLRAKNQRSGKNLSLIRNFKGVKFNRFEKFFEIFLFKFYLLLQVVADENAVFMTIFQKFFIFYSLHK